MSMIDPKQDRPEAATQQVSKPRKTQRERDWEEYGLNDRRDDDHPQGHPAEAAPPLP